MIISNFISHHFRHFNAAVLLNAAEAYRAHLRGGGKMLITLGGAMSTAELGLSLSEMIRQNHVHAISCTGANLEEDVLNLLAHNNYTRIPDWRDLSFSDEAALFDKHLNRVTDTCIPAKAIEILENAFLEECIEIDRSGKRIFPHEVLYRILMSDKLVEHYQIDPENSWVMAAAKQGIPLIVPGWEDSTLGNFYTTQLINGNLKNIHIIRTGIEYMIDFTEWYSKNAKMIQPKCVTNEKEMDPIEVGSIGIFQIGGGITGDFPICVVPMLRQTMGLTDLPLWGYFCQVSDSMTSYGGYSGAIPNEKITWGKLGVTTPRFMIESDATIVVPLIFAFVLRW